MPAWKIAAALVLLAVCPSAVQASCGDWLEHSPSPMSTAAETSLDGQAGNSVDHSIPLPSPCRGLVCERSPNSPVPLTPTERRPPLPDQLAIPWIADLLSVHAVDSLFLEASPQQLSGWPLRIDRPPEL